MSRKAKKKSNIKKMAKDFLKTLAQYSTWFQKSMVFLHSNANQLKRALKKVKIQLKSGEQGTRFIKKLPVSMDIIAFNI